jgi:hypothetical protein
MNAIGYIAIACAAGGVVFWIASQYSSSETVSNG